MKLCKLLRFYVSCLTINKIFEHCDPTQECEMRALSGFSQPRTGNYYQVVIGIIIKGVKFQPQNATLKLPRKYDMTGNIHNSKARMLHMSCLLVVYEFHMSIVCSQLYCLLFTPLNMHYKKSTT